MAYTRSIEWSLQHIVDELLAAAADYDIEACDRVLASAVADLEPLLLVRDVVSPLLREAGNRWHRGELAVVQEHMISGIVRRQLLLSVFFSGIFSTRSVGLLSLSAILFSIQLALRIIRFGENLYSFFVLENVIVIANTLVFIYINFRLLFRDQIVNAYRIVGAVNVYLLFALMGALTMEVIHAATGVSIGGNVVLTGTDTDYAQFIYFSLTSLTTVGFGDIYAVSAPARMLATFLAMLGILFPAIVIARLVGLAASGR